MTNMSKTLRIADLPNTTATKISWTPDSQELASLCADLDLLGLRKVRLEGRITPAGRDDWQLDAHIGATVTQPCVVTLDPVTTRIEEDISRLFLAAFEEPEESEIELDAGDEPEPLPEILDLAAIAREALALALPLSPRSPKADLIEANFAPEGVTPLTDETSKPFAGLAELKKKLEKDR